MGEKFERHKQAWTSDEVQKLHTLAKKGMPLRAIAKALTRSEESVKAQAKEDKLGIVSLREPHGSKAARFQSGAPPISFITAPKPPTDQSAVKGKFTWSKGWPGSPSWGLPSWACGLPCWILPDPWPSSVS